MKALLLLLLSLTTLQANDILVFKRTVVTKASTVTELNPGATPTGQAPVAYASTETSYLVVDTTAETYTEVSYQATGVPLVRSMVFGTSQPLSGLWNVRQPVKATTPDQFLIAFRDGSHVTDATDTDGDTVNDSFTEVFSSVHYSGIASPLKLSLTRTLPRVPRLLTGKQMETTYTDQNAIVLPEGTEPATRSFTRSSSTITIALDTVLTPAANLTDISGTTDIDPLTTAMKIAGTVANGLQRVRNALYAAGYRVQ